MKLILCKDCQDIVRLLPTPKSCFCGKCGGYAIDQQLAVYFGDTAVPIGINNRELRSAVLSQPEAGNGEEFTSFVIPKKCPSLFKVKEIRYTLMRVLGGINELVSPNVSYSELATIVSEKQGTFTYIPIERMKRYWHEYLPANPFDFHVQEIRNEDL